MTKTNTTKTNTTKTNTTTTNTTRYPDASSFTTQLENLQSQLPSILSDFEKYYVFYNKNPEYPEYQQMFENIKGNLNTINSDLFKLSNNVQSNIDSLNTGLVDLNASIEKAKKTNTKLKAELGIVEHKNNAATEMIYDYKQIYESGYLRNWALFLSSLVVIGAISKIYKPATSIRV